MRQKFGSAGRQHRVAAELRNPAVFFWIGASDVSFLLPLLDWRQRQAECRRSERRGVPHGTPLRFTVAGSLSVGVERLRQCIQSRFAREFRIGRSQCMGEFVGRPVCGQQAFHAFQIVDLEAHGIGPGCSTVSADEELGARCERRRASAISASTAAGEEICREFACAFAGAQWV